MSDKKIKAWLLPSARGEVAGSVDGNKLGYGKDNAISISESQLKRLKDAGVTGIQTESGSDKSSS